MRTLQSAFSHLQSASLTLSSPGMNLENFAMVAHSHGYDLGKHKVITRYVSFVVRNGTLQTGVEIGLASLIGLSKALKFKHSNSLKLQMLLIIQMNLVPLQQFLQMLFKSLKKSTIDYITLNLVMLPPMSFHQIMMQFQPLLIIHG